MNVIEIKRQEATLLQRKLRLVKDCGIAFYRPHDKQDAFHQAGVNHRFRAYFSGNRGGKSTGGTAEDVAWMLGERSWYPSDHAARYGGIPRRPVHIGVLTTDWGKVEEIFTTQQGDGGKFWKMLPRGSVKRTSRNHEGCIDTIELNNGSVVTFHTEQSFKKNPQSGESGDFDALHVDEPVIKEMWDAYSRGLMDREGTAAWFTLTPLREMWIHDAFVPNPLAEAGLVFPNSWHIRGTTRDNRYLSEQNVKDYEATLSVDERECRIRGIPLELSGLVYKEFDASRHVLQTLPTGWRAWNQPPRAGIDMQGNPVPGYTIYVAIDVHSQTPQAVMFVCVSPLGTKIVYDEIWLPCTADVLATEINLRIKGYTVGFIKCDPRAWDEDPVYNVSMASRFFQNGLNVEKSSKARDFGTINMRGVFASPNGIRFAPTVRRTLWELSRYVYDKENKPVDRDDHFMENMYRLFINEMPYIDSTSSRPVEDAEIEMTNKIFHEDDLSISKALEEMSV